MLYIIHQTNDLGLSYQGGQEPIVHLEADMNSVVDWAAQEGLRWAFTLSNAGAYGFEDRCELAQLHEIDWDAVFATTWQRCKHGKQAEFLLERSFPWQLVTRIGVKSGVTRQHVLNALPANGHRPAIEIHADWYY